MTCCAFSKVPAEGEAVSKVNIQIEAIVFATPQEVWAYWTQPHHIIQWNFASDDWKCPMASNDLRVGGKYSARMEAKDGSFGFDFEAHYDEVSEHRRLTYTLGDGRQVTTSFEDQVDRTKVTTIFEAETSNPVDMQKTGWQSILNNFKSYAEQQKST